MIKLEVARTILIEYGGYNLSCNLSEIMVKLLQLKENSTDYIVMGTSAIEIIFDGSIISIDFISDGITFELDATRSLDEVIAIFISTNLIDYRNYCYSDSGIYLEENSGTLTIDNLKMFIEILKNPIQHEIKISQKYIEMMSWVNEELFPVLKYFGYKKCNHLTLLHPKQDFIGVSFSNSKPGFNDIFIQLDVITGEITGSDILIKNDLINKLQYDIFNKIKENKSSEIFNNDIFSRLKNLITDKNILL